MLRKASVAGQFYPEDSKVLGAMIDGFSPKETNKVSAKGIILPHAGYVYSGSVAVATVSQILPRKRLIMLGPNHTGCGKSFALWSSGEWETPLASINIDQELANRILEKGSLISEDKLAHQHEHSLEVQLPIIYRFFGPFSFVPIACQPGSLETYRKVAQQITQGIKGIENSVLFVGSTDLTHYEPDQVARAKDRIAIGAMVNLDEEALIAEVKKNKISMCGLAPIAILICCLKEIGARKAQVTLYQTSGDTSGDKLSVVGYVGMAIM